MTYLEEVFQKLTIELYPPGRAFRLPVGKESVPGIATEADALFLLEDDSATLELETGIIDGGILRRLHLALDVSAIQLYNDAIALFNSIFPDNDGFGADDCAIWEYNLGITTNNTDLATRRLAIMRKMNYPGSVAPRQSAKAIQQQLQDAGFDLYIYENIFSDGMGGWITKTPAEVLGIAIGQAYLNNFDLGQLNLAAGYISAGITVLANHIEDAADADFTIGDNYRSTFFVAGSTITTFADVPAERHDELRQLLLTLKPVQTIGFLFINYI